MITANLNQEWMFRGGKFTLSVRAISDETGDPFVIPEDSVAKLRLAETTAHSSAVFEKEATSYVHPQGVMYFELTAVETANLAAMSYDLTVHIEHGLEIYPVYKGRFALVDYAPGADTEASSRRTVELLMRRVREELRADGPDGSGYSDFIIIDAINSALEDLSGIFTIRDTIEFETTAGQNSYDLGSGEEAEILNIIRVEYDGNKTTGRQIDTFLDMAVPTDGPVREWFLWGKQLTFIGGVEGGKSVRLWITRPPKRIATKGDVPETPGYVDEALVAYAISVCYRESKDYDRANYHYAIYSAQKNDLLRRAVPQGQRDHMAVMRSSYMGPFRQRRGFVRTDRNPGGSYNE